MLRVVRSRFVTRNFFSHYSLTNSASLPLGGSGSYKVSSTQATVIPSYSSYPGGSDLSSRYASQPSQFSNNNSTDRSNSTSTVTYSDNNNHSTVSILHFLLSPA